MIRKGKRSLITQDNEAEIAKRATESNKQRTKLAEDLQSTIKWEGPPPEVEVLERKISHYRKLNHGYSAPRDKIWSIGRLHDHDMPAEALPLLVSLAAESKKDGKPLTVREAQWVIRLLPFIQNVRTLKLTKSGLLLWWARSYANSERLHEMLNRDFETFHSDSLINRYPEEYTIGTFLWDAIAKDKGEEWAGAFFRYTLLFNRKEGTSPSLTEDQLGRELVDIEKVLGKNKFETWAETWKGIAERQVARGQSLYEKTLESGQPDDNILKDIEQSKLIAKTFERIQRKEAQDERPHSQTVQR